MEIKVWNLESGIIKKTLGSHWSDITSLAFSRDGRYLASGAFDKTINIWDTQKGRLLTTLIDNEDNPHGGVAISSVNNLVVSASYSKLKIWDLHKGKIIRIIPVSKEEYDLYSFVLTPDGKFIIAGLQGPPPKGGLLCTWRIADGVLVHEMPIKQHFEGYYQELNNITISQDGIFIIGASAARMVKVWMNFLIYLELEEVFMKSREKLYQ